MPQMSVNLAGLALRNPIIAAAGTCGYIREIADVIDPRSIGGIVTKSITPEAREGNAPWRIVDLPRAPGMLNAIGLANVGVERFLKEKLPDAKSIDCVVIGSIAGHSVDDYVAVATAFDQSGLLPAVELNVSCPNTADGLQFGEHPDSLGGLLRAVRPVLRHSKMIIKLSPNVGDIVAMARAAIDGGADALTLVNTVAAMSIDPHTRQPRLSRGAGGMSGPAIHAIAVRMVSDVYRGVAREANVPIIGLGGVMTWEDAAEFILAGATAVGMGTAMFVDPRLLPKVARGLEQWAAKQGCTSISELLGQVKIS
ncbi:MAG TPA: dihydroorotate dehydrogenase [Phycisphaerales bacterium]|nr:dihydroorotate dehydrogenase [Phycisphaerales bacterium]